MESLQHVCHGSPEGFARDFVPEEQIGIQTDEEVNSRSDLGNVAAVGKGENNIPQLVNEGKGGYVMNDTGVGGVNGNIPQVVNYEFGRRCFRNRGLQEVNENFPFVLNNESNLRNNGGVEGVNESIPVIVNNRSNISNIVKEANENIAHVVNNGSNLRNIECVERVNENIPQISIAGPQEGDAPHEITKTGRQIRRQRRNQLQHERRRKRRYLALLSKNKSSNDDSNTETSSALTCKARSSICFTNEHNNASKSVKIGSLMSSSVKMEPLNESVKIKEEPLFDNVTVKEECNMQEFQGLEKELDITIQPKEETDMQFAILSQYSSCHKHQTPGMNGIARSYEDWNLKVGSKEENNTEANSDPKDEGREVAQVFDVKKENPESDSQGHDRTMRRTEFPISRNEIEGTSSQGLITGAENPGELAELLEDPDAALHPAPPMEIGVLSNASKKPGINTQGRPCYNQRRKRIQRIRKRMGKTNKLCKLCLKNVVKFCTLPCFHFSYCEDCVQKAFINSACAVCNAVINKVVRVKKS